jgi:Glucose / Sorbosone dehydrogenase
MVRILNRHGWHLSFALLLLATILIGPGPLRAQYPSSPQITKDGTAILLEDYASAPLSSDVWDSYPPPINYHSYLGKLNSLRSEPANAPKASSRFFVNDASAILYILDKQTRKFTPYINFAQVFPKFTGAKGNSTGLISITFDPDYARNGKFYTVHAEYVAKPAPEMPTNAHMPSLNLDGYATTPPVNPPGGSACCQSVVVEWTDTNIDNDTFEGTAREILRVGFSFTRHQMDDLLFNPTARPRSDDYRNLYISLGDGGSGEVSGVTHPFPQLLSALPGKILRIIPDLNLHPKDMLSANGRYRIPSSGADPNPFVTVQGARPEVFAYGLRNPHRLAWDVPTKTFIANDIGLHSWEEIDIISKGANYGYAEREGEEQVFITDGPEDGKTGSQVSPQIPFPGKDLLTVQGIDEPVAPVYPAAEYSHWDGDAIGSGFVYRGKLMPQLNGKYIFNDMTTGRLFYADLAEMIATRGQRNKLATIHELQVMYKNPNDSSEKAPLKRRLYDIVADGFAHKGGIPRSAFAPADSHLGVLPGKTLETGGWEVNKFVPGRADAEGVPYGGGRADVRVCVGGDGEMYILSKSDGMVRKVTALVTPPPTTTAGK